MNGPKSEQLAQLQAEVQTLREAIHLLTKSMQLRAADAEAVTVMVQALAGMTMLPPLRSEPLAFVLRELYKVHRDKPKVTALYRERFDRVFKSLLPPDLKHRVFAD